MHSLDFLDTTGAPIAEPKRSVSLLRVLAWSFGVCVFAFILLISAGAWTVYAGYRDVQAALRSLKALDIPAASASLASAKRHTETLHTGFLLAQPFEVLPIIGPELVAARFTTEAAIDGFAGAGLLMKPLGDVVAVVHNKNSHEASAVSAFRSLSPDAKRELLQKLLAASPDIDRAASRLREADDVLSSIPNDGLADAVRVRLDPLRASVHSARIDVDTFAPLAQLLPELLGGVRERTLLFVFQNSDELRPTGGFIGTYGIFHAKDGDFSISDIRDVYTLDRPANAFFKQTPPEPFAKYLAATNWFFRDANWSPDFPTSAAMLLDFYTREKGDQASKMDGVLALTPRVVERLAGLVGCMNIQQIDFCPENILTRLQYEVEKGYDVEGIPEPQRKQIMAPLAAEFLKRLYALPSSRLPEVFDIIRDSFMTKDVLLWSADKELEGAIQSAGIAGRLKWETPDGFMVVDANLGGMKTDPFVKRTIQYTVVPNGDEFDGTIEITYKNTAPLENWKWTTYRTWTRVYLPPGSEWIETIGSLDNDRGKNPLLKPGKTVVQDELGYASFGAFTAIDIGEERTLVFKFRLAPQVVQAIRRGEYLLTVLRQPGAPNHALTIDIGFGKNLLGAYPPESVLRYGDDRYEVTSDLSVDRNFTVTTQ